MTQSYFSIKGCFFGVLFLMITSSIYSQVGIGTVTPNASSVLDVTSTTQGMLTPRMTSVQRTAIVSPADGLMVYDTDLKSFFHYNTTAVNWTRISSDFSGGRNKFKRIKSTDVLATVLAAEKAAGGGSKYLLDSGTAYEINGTIAVDLPIELNNSYVIGIDSGDDKLVKATGDLFVGTTGGSVRVLTLTATAGKVFNINGGGNQNLIFRDSIILNSANVGTIENFSLVFLSIVQYAGNSNGFTFNTISKLLLSNMGWFGNNAGTFEKIEGTFGLIQKQGGFSEVNGTAIGFDVSSNPIINGDAVMESVVFTGSNSAGYIRGYTPATYLGYNFNNNWSVRCAGIPTEVDAAASGNIYLNRTLTAPVFNHPSLNQGVKIPGTTIASNLYRMGITTSSTSNRLAYLGKKSRSFTIAASVAFEASGSSGNTDYIFYFQRFNAAGLLVSRIISSESFIDANSGFIQNIPILANVQMNSGDYIELFSERILGNDKNMTIRSVNVSMQ
ncbi:hypothetical protein SAMN05444396_10274 [Flavobacterium segetis]|uniref:Cell wall anchor protein n=1 Tax=Flavobacterium segetis TaxID=271157 RepID=A0A1M5F1N8_9FLAO|nr:hypothetical protein [Flavobacterium segetis]SHF85347.1 hypothetical protein SAMN05444396_10274 [Flavobacterium segetis]